ncbi:MAG TPA: lytic murein transglycosylase [Bauldia sp.]|nr:lytic murein transglycosylase [Bauldia sp.]
MRHLLSVLLPLAAVVAVAMPAAAATSCHKEPTFEAWLDGVRAEARADGISSSAIDSALSGVVFDPAIVKKDHAQGVFTQDFLQFSTRMAAAYRISTGKSKIAQMKSVFDRIEKTYGVPAPVLTAFWALETDFGAFNGDGPTLTSLATLGYDCRRPDLFRLQLIDAMKIIDRGDLSAAQMRGPWAGELGQLQFIPQRYYDYGVDFDGDGRVDLLNSSADALASAANYLKALGWHAGQPWLQEVLVPADLPWDQADLSIKLPLAKWAGWGVTLANGKALPANGPDASLFLPMGRNGPAFLAYPNFDVYLQWNNSLVYSSTAAYLATRIAGAGPVHRGTAVSVSAADVRALQQILAKKGYNVGKADGVIGAATRAAVKAEQIKFGLPADSYPSAELLAREQAGG